MASRTGPRLMANSSASSCSPMRAPGASVPAMMRSPTCAATCSGTVRVGSRLSASSRNWIARSQRSKTS